MGYSPNKSGILLPDSMREPRRSLRPEHRFSFDVAQTTPQNSNHWAAADSLSPDAALSQYNRQIVANRARYEVANNTFASGIVDTLVNFIVGTGPSLQMILENEDYNRQIETDWAMWAAETFLARLLRTIISGRKVTGEGCGLIFTDEKLRHSVKINVLPFEVDMLTSPLGSYDPYDIDGVRVDKYGRPVDYRIMNEHPGGNVMSSVYDATLYPAEAVIHTFKRQRAGQHRGISELMPALPSFAYLRRLDLAVLAAYEFAASFSGIVSAKLPPGSDDEPSRLADMSVFNLARNSLVALPEDYTLQQLKAEHPSSAYKDFHRMVINAIARVFNMPYNIAACDSAGYNYSSGRLDHQTFFKSVYVEQREIEHDVLDSRLFPAWLDEYALQNTWVFDTSEYQRYGTLPHTWFWNTYESIDPKTEADAAIALYEARMTTLQEIYGKRGLDWEKQLRQWSAEEKLLDELGISPQKAIVRATKTENN